jgi:translation initiation factor IF-2
MAKVQVRDLAKQMGIPDKDLIFKLQSLGVQVESPTAAIDHEVIVAILTGKKLATRPRNVIMREEKPLAPKEKPQIKPPRPIVKPPRKPVTAAAPEAAPPPAPSGPIIPEFVEAAEAEAAEQERAAREVKPAAAVPAIVAPPVSGAAAAEADAAAAGAVIEEPKVAAEPQPASLPKGEPEVEAPAAAAAPPPAAPSAPAAPPAPPAAVPHSPRTISGPTGPRARAATGPRPNYANAQRVPTGRPAGTTAARPAAPAAGARAVRSGAPGAAGRPDAAGMRPGGAARPAGPARPGAPRPGGRIGGGPAMPPPPAAPGSTLVRRRKAESEEERPEKKKTTGKRGKRTSAVEVDNELFTKGPFSATAVLDDDLGPDVVARPASSGEETDEVARHTPSSRRDSRKQAAPVTAKVLEFKRPTGKVTLSEGVTVKELADRLGIKANDLMKHLLMKKGLMVSINAPLGNELAQDIARDLGLDAEFVSFEEAVELEAMEKVAGAKSAGTDARAPVITVMGHVDHGKTSLLDAIRETNVAAGEAGGITQHIGAYQVEKKGRKITFLDTPGHEAFTMMRARGAKVTDIVVLVVAADDGVMPQTREAIDHARAAGVPMIVAINKIDKPNANTDRVRQELSGAGVLVEQWGGDVVSVEVSAIKKTGIDDLLDMILLTADIQELKATPELPARAVVLEARKEVGRGTVATVLVQDGTLKIGDAFFSGATSGRVRAMSDERGARIKEAGPSMPVAVTGFDEIPNAGDTLQVIDEESRARMIGQLRQEKMREAAAQKGPRMSLDQLFKKMQSGNVKELNIILKADVQGSVEVLQDTLRKQSTQQVSVNILHSSVGAISTNDVLLASASEAIVVGFNVRPERSAAELAEKEGVEIRLHTVIYNLTDEIRQAMTGLLEPRLEEVFQGRAEVRATFKVPKMGTIAGCMVTDGIIPRSANVRLVRDGRVIYEGKIQSLRHFKNDVSEVRTGFECGIGIERFQDIKNGDIIEAFKIEKFAGVLQ